MATKQVRKTAVKAESTVIDNDKIETSISNDEVVEPKIEKKVFKDDDGIPCESITSGELGMVGAKTGINYSWVNYGDVIDVEYSDLVAAIRARKDSVMRPRFIIKDDEFLSQFPQMNEVYGAMYTVKDLKEILRLDVTSMANEISKMPKGVKDSLVGIAATMIDDGRIDSRKTVKKLEEIFGKKFTLLSEE